VARYGRWIAGALVAAIVTSYVVAMLLDAPLRRITERQMNARLKGYTVALGQLDFHPVGGSVELRDVVLSQVAHPEPPVLRVPHLVISVQWSALIRGRLVADLQVDDPVLHVARTNLEREIEDETPLRSRGWQAAVEAMYPLKINAVVVRRGALSYVESDPARPLELRDIEAVIENIRNRSSASDAYPSPLRIEAIVFDAGRLTVDADADFLRTPHAALKGVLEVEQMELDYFQPVAERYGLSLAAGELGARGRFEYTPESRILRLGFVRIRGLRGDYVHAGPTAARAHRAAIAAAKAAREVSNKPGILLEVERMEVRDSAVSFVNEQTSPHYRVSIDPGELVVENLSNQRKEGTATAHLAGRLMGSGAARMDATFRPESRGPDFDLDLSVEDADLGKLNDLLRAHADVDVASGRLSVYSEMHVKNGRVEGYVKPLFSDVSVYDSRQDAAEPLTTKLKEKAADLAAKLLRNRSREEVATVVPIAGPVSDPDAGTLRTLVGLLRNAFIEAILPGFENQRSLPARAG